tara:strand:+ start:8653 stop:9342 length:690 start_codon:yes stop_codon:yes gene_type:complete
MMKKIFLFTIIIVTFSCNYFNPSKQSQTYIRIVDSNGKPKKVKTFPPELNIGYLAAQKQEKLYPHRDRIEQQVQKKEYQDPDPTNNLISQNQNYQNTIPSKQNSNYSAIPEKQRDNKTPAPIIYKLSGQGLEQKSLKNNNKPAVKKTSKTRVSKGDLLIQIASFSNRSKALLAQKKENIKNSKIISVKVGQKIYHKLVVGPFKNKKNSNITLNKLKRLGYKDAFYYKFK